MDLLDFNIFKNFYICRNITAVSRRLYLSQPTISYRLNKLQEELNVKLYEYDGEYHFTDQSKVFFQFCENMLTEFEGVQKKLKIQQLLKINLSTVAAYLYLDKIYTILKLKEIYPVISFTSSDIAITELIEGRAFLSIVGGIKVDLSKSIEKVSLKREKLVLIYNSACRDEISDIPIIIDEHSSGIHKLVLDYLDKFENVEIVGEIGLTSERISLVSAHKIGFFIPESYLDILPNIYPTVKVSDKYFFYRDILLLYNKKDSSNELVKIFIEKLNE